MHPNCCRSMFEPVWHRINLSPQTYAISVCKLTCLCDALKWTLWISNSNCSSQKSRYGIKLHFVSFFTQGMKLVVLVFDVRYVISVFEVFFSNLFSQQFFGGLFNHTLFSSVVPIWTHSTIIFPHMPLDLLHFFV